MTDDDPLPVRLPDDIEQKLLDGQRSRATHDLAERRRCTVYEARMLVSRWLFEQGLARTAEGRQRSLVLTPCPNPSQR